MVLCVMSPPLLILRLAAEAELPMVLAPKLIVPAAVKPKWPVVLAAICKVFWSVSTTAPVLLMLTAPTKSLRETAPLMLAKVMAPPVSCVLP